MTNWNWRAFVWGVLAGIGLARLAEDAAFRIHWAIEDAQERERAEAVERLNQLAKEKAAEVERREAERHNTEESAGEDKGTNPRESEEEAAFKVLIHYSVDQAYGGSGEAGTQGSDGS